MGRFGCALSPLEIDFLPIASPDAICRRIHPASGRYAAARNQQISEPQQQRQPLRVFGQTPIAHLGVSEVPLHVQERMLHFGTLWHALRPCTSLASSQGRPVPVGGAHPDASPPAKPPSIPGTPDVWRCLDILHRPKPSSRLRVTAGVPEPDPTHGPPWWPHYVSDPMSHPHRYAPSCRNATDATGLPFFA